MIKGQRLGTVLLDSNKIVLGDLQGDVWWVTDQCRVDTLFLNMCLFLCVSLRIVRGFPLQIKEKKKNKIKKERERETF